MKKGLSLVQKNKLAQEEHEAVIQWKNIASASFLHIGKSLKKIKDEKLYKYLGESPEYESFELYILQPEIGIELRKAYYLIQIYEVFIDQLKFKMEDLQGLYWTSLRLLLPVIKEENSRDLVEKAKILSRTDLEIEMKQLRHGIKSPMDCEHEWREITFYECIKCRERAKLLPKGSKIVEKT